MDEEILLAEFFLEDFWDIISPGFLTGNNYALTMLARKLLMKSRMTLDFQFSQLNVEITNLAVVEA